MPWKKSNWKTGRENDEITYRTASKSKHRTAKSKCLERAIAAIGTAAYVLSFDMTVKLVDVMGTPEKLI